MNRNKAILLFASLLLLFSASQYSYGQLQQLATPRPVDRGDISKSSFRIKEEPLPLPFWDDFSSKGIAHEKWVSEGATHSFTVGNSAPSLGVVLLDGVDENGKPYDNVPVAQGVNDQLSSQPIDLSGLSPEEAGTVFLSFYWQAGGKAEIPDINDRLTLAFLDSIGNWVDVWSIIGELEAEQFFFSHEIMQVTPEFHHNAFQFRFQINGRSSGPFDSWLLDYIYLNKGRSSSDLFFPDRALTQTNASPFEKHSAVPLFELKRNPEKYWTSTQNEFKNLEDRFRAMEFSIEVREKESNSLIQRINDNTPFNPVPLAQERRFFDSNEISGIELPEEETDWEIVTYLSSGDNFLYTITEGDTTFFRDVDFRLNDSTRTVLHLRDYFAYDDGSLDYSAGINQRSGMLAVRYEIESEAYVTGLSINFTNFNQIGRGVDLMIWSDLNEDPLFVKESLIREKESQEEFTYYEIDTNIRVSENFYIGFMQFTNDFIYVGLDKTRDSGSEIFYNVRGSWEQNEFVSGSLMIRPHLSENPPYVEEETSIGMEIKAYPNPVSDRLYIEGKFEAFTVYDPYGRKLNLPAESYEKGKILNFAGLHRGVYLVGIIQEGQQKSIRILVK